MVLCRESLAQILPSEDADPEEDLDAESSVKVKKPYEIPGGSLQPRGPDLSLPQLRKFHRLSQRPREHGHDCKRHWCNCRYYMQCPYPAVAPILSPVLQEPLYKLSGQPTPLYTPRTLAPQVPLAPLRPLKSRPSTAANSLASSATSLPDVHTSSPSCARKLRERSTAKRCFAADKAVRDFLAKKGAGDDDDDAVRSPERTRCDADKGEEQAPASGQGEPKGNQQNLADLNGGDVPEAPSEVKSANPRGGLRRIKSLWNMIQEHAAESIAASKELAGGLDEPARQAPSPAQDIQSLQQPGLPPIRRSKTGPAVPLGSECASLPLELPSLLNFPATGSVESDAVNVQPPGGDNLMSSVRYSEDADLFSDTADDEKQSNKVLSRLKSTLRERMQRLHVRRVARQWQSQVLQVQDLRQAQFNGLPKTETDMIQTVFNHNDVSTGFLDLRGVLRALRDLGLCGSSFTSAERNDISQICTEVTRLSAQGTAQGKISVDLLSFALDVVPHVRAKMRELQADKLVEQFYQLDIENLGRIHGYRIIESTRVLGLDRHATQKAIESTVGSNGLVSLERFQDLVTAGREAVNRVINEREFQIKAMLDVPDELFKSFRDDIVRLHDIYTFRSQNDTQEIGRLAIRGMLSEFGLRNSTVEERSQVEQIFNDYDPSGKRNFSFSDFLVIVNKVRELRSQSREDAHRHWFVRYDRDRNGKLSVEEISNLLCDLGCAPTHRKEQEQIGQLIHSVDLDSNGSIDFGEFQLLDQRIDERFKSLRFEQEVNHAIQLGFTEFEVHDLRAIFDSLDLDFSGRLEICEVRSCLTLLKKQITNEAFDQFFAELDADGSGELCFLEFLELVRMMRDHDGIFAEDTPKFAQCARLLDRRLLHRVLEQCGVPKDYVKALSTEALVDLFCCYFEVRPNDNLWDKFKFNKVENLLEMAKSLGDHSSAKKSVVGHGQRGSDPTVSAQTHRYAVAIPHS